jgi:hypothetical protein
LRFLNRMNIENVTIHLNSKIFMFAEVECDERRNRSLELKKINFLENSVNVEQMDHICFTTYPWMITFLWSKTIWMTLWMSRSFLNSLSPESWYKRAFDDYINTSAIYLVSESKGMCCNISNIYFTKINFICKHL